jgi:monoamine oxidase
MKTLIIGGGLSGLALADALETRGHDYMLIEARARFGGRIKTERHGAGYYDMGPGWFWPAQPRIAALIDRLNLKKFDQFTDGDLAFEDEHGQVQRGRGFASMQGSWRLEGGLAALTDALSDRLPQNRKRLNAAVVSLTQTGTGIIASLSNGDTLQAAQVVLSLPPRVAANLSFSPTLPQNANQSMQNIPTWMAGQAKAVAVYDIPFWRDEGLSGDAQSRRGPMIEIHDASPAHGGPYALFGFIGMSPDSRADERVLRHHIQAQLVRLFGPNAANPVELYIKDWAFDPYTSTDLDKAPLYAHPAYQLPTSLSGLWNSKLFFSGSEVAAEFGGYVEGALEAAEGTLRALEAQK